MKSKYEEISVNGKRYLKHRYVWEQYNGKIPDGYEIHHRDMNTHNNNISNLTMLTIKEHRSLHSKMQIGHVLSDETKNKIRNARIGKKASNETRKKMSDSYNRKVPVICVELNKKFPTIQDAALFINKDRKGIYSCLKGNQNTCGGYHWTQLITGEDA